MNLTLKQRQDEVRPSFGLFDGYHADDYFAHPAVSRSDLKPFSWGTPYDVWVRKFGGQSDETTTAMEFGTVVHTALLEPHRFYSRVVQYAGKTRGVNFNKTQKADPEKIYVTEPEYVMLAGMQKSLKNKRVAWGAIKSGKIEQTLFWKDPKTDLECKARIDLLNGWVFDLKTCGSLSDDALRNDCKSYGYFHQAAFYMRGLREICGDEFKNFAHIWVSKKPPYLVRVVRVPQTLIAEADKDLDVWLEMYADNLRAHGTKNQWPAYDDLIEDFYE